MGTGVPLRTWGVCGGFSHLVNFKLFLTFVREELSQKVASSGCREALPAFPRSWAPHRYLIGGGLTGC